MAVEDIAEDFEEIPKLVSGNKRIEAKIDENEISISTIFDGRIIRIYPGERSAEFLDIDFEWEYLPDAVKYTYAACPELVDVVDYLNKRHYSITW